MPKDLFADDLDGPLDVKVNSGFATKFEQVKRKQELQVLNSKHGKTKLDDDSDEESSEVEDEDAELLTEDKEAAFANVMSAIFRNDSVLEDKSHNFFAANSEAEQSVKGSKTFTLKEEYQRRIKGEILDDEPQGDPLGNSKKKMRPQTQQEAQIREAFLSAAAEVTDAVDVTKKSSFPLPAVPDKKSQVKEVLDAAFKSHLEVVQPKGEQLANEEFLRNFFVQELWKPSDEDKERGNYSWEQLAADEQDEFFFDDAEVWEKEFQEKQYRHEEGAEALQVQSFARRQEGVLRAKPTSRREQRLHREERLRDAQVRQVEELKRLKVLKRQEIEEQRKMIIEVAGLKKKSSKASGFSKLNPEQLKELLQGDFDSKKFDAHMSALFDADYDEAVDEDEVDEIENELDVHFPEEDDDNASSEDDDDDDDDGDDDTYSEEVFADTYEEEMKKAEKKPKVVENQDRFLADDDFAMLYPSQAIRNMEAQQPSVKAQLLAGPADTEQLSALQIELDKKVDEYWKLHFHKVAGGVRTRFKYRNVNPETFGLTDIDVLGKDDRQLNMIAPLNCYAAYLGPEENQRDRYKALHRRKNVREIDPARSSRRYGSALEKTKVIDNDISPQEAAQISKRLREGPLAEAATEAKHGGKKRRTGK